MDVNNFVISKNLLSMNVKTLSLMVAKLSVWLKTLNILAAKLNGFTVPVFGGDDRVISETVTREEALRLVVRKHHQNIVMTHYIGILTALVQRK